LLVSVVTTLAMAAPLATVSPAAAATASAPTFVGVVPSTASARTGSTLSVKVVAENSKKSKSAAHALNFLISKTTSPTGARKVGSGTIPSIAAKTRKTFTFKVPIPSNAAAGSFRLLFCHPRTGKPLLCHNDNVKLAVSLAPAKLTISPTSHNYGDVPTNEGYGKRFTVRNVGRRWSGAVTVSRSGASSFDFLGYSCGPSLAPNATCTIDAIFLPLATGAAHATLKVKPSANYSTGATASLSGTGVKPAQLTISSVNDFGGVLIGESSPTQVVTLTNTGDQPSGTLAPAFTGANVDDFSIHDDTCSGGALAAGASCTLKVRFDPQAADDRSANLQVSAAPGGPATIPLTGVGLRQPILSSSGTLRFGPIVVGSSSADLTAYVTNNGDVPSGTITTSLAFPAADQFSLSDDQCNGQILAAHASCTVNVRFNPTSEGTHYAGLNAVSTLGSAAQTSLVGTAVTP